MPVATHEPANLEAHAQMKQNATVEGEILFICVYALNGLGRLDFIHDFYYDLLA